MSDNASTFELIRDMAMRADYAFSLGTFGASGEFMRTEDEHADQWDEEHSFAIATAKGALKITRSADPRLIAYDTLSGDGESWSQGLAACIPFSDDAPEVITPLGADTGAIRPEDRNMPIFDLGVGKGLVRMCVRASDAELIGALEAAAGTALMGNDNPGLPAKILASQPVRVMLSPFARIEVYQNIPHADGQSPEGPHTHLLPQLLGRRRTHSSNTPIPEGLQSVLNIHPPSPWRDGMGQRIAFDADRNAEFEQLLARFGLGADKAVRDAVTVAVLDETVPEDFPSWPTRRERTQMRITLRRLAASGGHSVDTLGRWRAVYDRMPVEADPEEELA